ncbi:glycolate oxidase [Microbispora corallina]|uniref:Glycolate oxidase n=1 Tax=Microbispora corallina TaxID=83302 RepID=A0ABQ4FSH0_9ACTN|nr:FAD-binding oxidoreductase [Microbispora corallina]GIH37653.1 glycolate oxidase [Microbispora corallina]
MDGARDPRSDETTEQAGKALAASGVAVRAAGADDVVAGVPPRWVALPETAEEIAAVLRVSEEHDLAVVPVGGGTKLHWGAPPSRCDVLLDTCCLNEVVEHEAGDLVVRAQAGLTVEALAEALAAKGQELALDVPVPGTTIGGLVATAIAGPRRFRYGTVRDLLIGITVVLADGTIAHAGGKVVKNVAGYDLGKLFTGSYGTLGVVADATFRLHPLPPSRTWAAASFARPVRSGPGGDASEEASAPEAVRLAGELHAALAAAAGSQAEPVAVELDWPDVTGPATVAVLVEGAASAERADAVRALLGPEARTVGERPGWWGRLPSAPPPSRDGARAETDAGRDEEPPAGRGETLLELRASPSRVAGALAAVHVTALETGTPAAVRGSAPAGVVHVALRADAGRTARFADALRARVEAADGRLVVLSAPPEAADGLDRWGRVGALALMRRVKERFDPGGRMSPGRFVGGI